MPVVRHPQERKDKVWANVQKACNEYTKCIFVNCDNVTSKQICVMRKALRGIDAFMVMGKNTLMKAAILELQEQDKTDNKPERPHLALISQQLTLNTGMIFSNGDLAEVKKILDSQVREAPARIGSIAPADVTVPAGPTGMDPKQTSFFQALNIQTKIVKGQVEIVNAVKVISTDDKITAGQAALLDKLKIRPFEYKMHIKQVLDNNKLYPPAVLSITLESVIEKFQASAKVITALSLGSGYVTNASAHHVLLNGFKNLVTLSFGSGFSIPQAEKMLSAAASRPAASSGPANAPAKVVEAAKAPEPEPEVDVDMGDLFGY